MTKEQALQNLSLPADADMETVRMRFAARYTLSDTQYDRTLTDGMKAVHEQHLRELEQAYKVITDNPVIDDMGALLSLGKGYVEEDGDTIRTDSVIPSDEALAFFALYPHDSPVLAEQRYTQYVSELEAAIEQVGLEASKEPYRKEIAHAEACLSVVINYLLASQMLASQQEEAAARENEATPELEMDAFDEPTYVTPTPPKPSNKRYGVIAAAAIALLAIGIWIGRGSGTEEDGKDKMDTDTPSSIADIPAQRSVGTSADQGQSAPGKIADIPTADPQRTDDVAIDATPQSPQQVIESLLKTYAKGYDVQVEKDAIKLTGKSRYIFPYQNILDINERGEFIGADLLVEGQSRNVSEGLRLSNISKADKDHIMKAIRAIKALRPSLAKNTAPTNTERVTDKEVQKPNEHQEKTQPSKKEAIQGKTTPGQESQDSGKPTEDQPKKAQEEAKARQQEAQAKQEEIQKQREAASKEKTAPTKNETEKEPVEKEKPPVESE